VVDDDPGEHGLLAVARVDDAPVGREGDGVPRVGSVGPPVVRVLDGEEAVALLEPLEPRGRLVHPDVDLTTASATSLPLLVRMTLGAGRSADEGPDVGPVPPFTSIPGEVDRFATIGSASVEARPGRTAAVSGLRSTS
jgi:hypothetical protein